MKIINYTFLLLVLGFSLSACREEPVDPPRVELTGVYKGDYTIAITDSTNNLTTTSQVAYAKIANNSFDFYEVGLFADTLFLDTIIQYSFGVYDNPIETCEYEERILPNSAKQPFIVEVKRTECESIQLIETEKQNPNTAVRTFVGNLITNF